MKKVYLPSIAILLFIIAAVAFRSEKKTDAYLEYYNHKLNNLTEQQIALEKLIVASDLNQQAEIAKIKEQIGAARIQLKQADIWLRYLEPVSYRKINGPLPVEWETEVHEKHEKPYKRIGSGLSLAELYLEEKVIDKNTLLQFIQSSIEATNTYRADSITSELQTADHFFFCNRLYLLNLAAIYTTGVECPDAERIIPELRSMVSDLGETYSVYNSGFPTTPLSAEYLTLYKKMVDFVDAQPVNYEQFDHFTFIRDYVNPLYGLNQELIRQYQISSKSLVDYAMNNTNTSIFNKSLYVGQNPKGIFLRVKDEKVLAEIERLGKLLFYDPILSENNKRSCISCHNNHEYYTLNSIATPLHYDQKDHMERNSPSLINAMYNQLLFADGHHISFRNQGKDALNSAAELGGNERDVLNKILSCNEYAASFKNLLKYTPEEKEITVDHVVSAISYYHSRFSMFYSPFDDAMNDRTPIGTDVKKGFNIYMSKAQCATCHFIPHTNGVKPPYTESEFEVLGIPADTLFTKQSPDEGRYNIFPEKEMLFAFRTGTVRNAEHTGPFMHNGVFTTLEQVIDFYDAGGGIGNGLDIPNQTLSSDSLHLSKDEKTMLIAFVKSLNEKIIFDSPPATLPRSKDKSLNDRKVGGNY